MSLPALPAGFPKRQVADNSRLAVQRCYPAAIAGAIVPAAALAACGRLVRTLCALVCPRAARIEYIP